MLPILPVKINIAFCGSKMCIYFNLSARKKIKKGAHLNITLLDSRFRGNDKKERE
jgi:hypothetical protein